MSKAEYTLLQDVIMDADFPDLDLALRRGRHIDRDDAAWYSLLSDAQEQLEPFYRRYGCELIHKTDGYFYLLPTGEKVSRKQLSATDMVVGQALALLYLDPAAVERGGVVSQEEIVGQLSAVLGSDALISVFSPGKRKRQDERIAQRNVRQRVSEAVRRLASLGFVEQNDDSAVRLRAALLRFAEPVRGLSEPAEALAKLVAQGEVTLTPEELDESGEDADEERADAADEPEHGGDALAESAEARDGARGEGVADDALASSAEARDGIRGEGVADDALAGSAEAREGARGERVAEDALAGSAEERGGARAEREADEASGELFGAAGAVRAAHGGAREGERATAVVRKPRAPVVDDLEWADIVVPERDAEDGS